MFDIDEKLFNMKKSLLLRGNAKDSDLLDYKRLVEKMDYQEFNKIKNKIDELSNNNHSYEEELSILEEIKNDYNDLEIHQCQYNEPIETNPKYIHCKLKLTNLSEIGIENINNRLSAINGY